MDPIALDFLIVWTTYYKTKLVTWDETIFDGIITSRHVNNVRIEYTRTLSVIWTYSAIALSKMPSFQTLLVLFLLHHCSLNIVMTKNNCINVQPFSAWDLPFDTHSKHHQTIQTHQLTKYHMFPIRQQP